MTFDPPIYYEVTELWNRIKNSYRRHSHKRLRPHLHIIAGLQIILILHTQSTFNCNCYQETDWLFKIRIVNMQKYVGAVVDVCGVAAIRIFDAIP
jgi:hypothetical protein